MGVGRWSLGRIMLVSFDNSFLFLFLFSLSLPFSTKANNEHLPHLFSPSISPFSSLPIYQPLFFSPLHYISPPPPPYPLLLFFSPITPQTSSNPRPAPRQIDSKHILPSLFNHGFRRREARAREVLAGILEGELRGRVDEFEGMRE